MLKRAITNLQKRKIKRKNKENKELFHKNDYQMKQIKIKLLYSKNKEKFKKINKILYIRKKTV